MPPRRCARWRRGRLSPTFSKSQSAATARQKDEHGDAWGVWNRALVGLPNSPENFLITQFIKDVYLDSQVTSGC